MILQLLTIRQHVARDNKTASFLRLRSKTKLEKMLDELRLIDVGLYVYMLLAPMEDLLVFSYGSTVNIVTMFLVVCCLLHIANNSGFLGFNRAEKLLIGWFLVLVVALMWSTDVEYGVNIYIKPFLLNILVVLVLSRCNYTERNVRVALQCFIVGLLILVVLFFINANSFGMAGRVTYLTDENYIDPNGMGDLFALGAVALLSLYPKKRRRYYIQVFFAIILIVGLILTASRGAVVVLLLGLVASLVFDRNNTSRRRKIVLFCLGVIILVFLIGDKNGLLSGLLNRLTEETGRGGIWDMVLSAAMENPLFGCGTGSRIYIPVAYSYNAAFENNLLTVFFMSGLVGFLPFLIFLYELFRFRDKTDLGVAIRSILVVSIVAGFFIFTMKQRLFWVPVLLCLLLIRCDKQCREKP